ncbi:oligosaccharide flippase family protein [Aurantimonas sp. A2-1-M11]|uniref:oligosaccharide flippase family protein n=1 Tax=Aurantimonas sp. A2-1-M11 TaxID=3113712 RepID=UPI002F91EBC9
MFAVRRALLLSTGERYFALVSNFLTVAIVSRILTPEEIGVSVIGMAVIGMTMALREFASASFLFQQQSLTEEAVRGAFTIMLCLTAVISGALAASAPWIAAAYGEDRLVPYLEVISVSLLVEVVAIPILTLWLRDMAFGKLAVVRLSGAATASLVTVILALAGFSYMSFAWAWLCSALVTGGMAIALRGDLRLYRPSLTHWRAMLTFGGYNGGTAFLYKIYEALPYLLLGRILSLDAAAIYSRSLMICQLPDKILLGGITAVVLPAFSSEARQGRNLRDPYLNALSFITALQWPALVMLAILAYPVVDILLGNQWTAVAPLVQIIALASLFSFSFELNYPVLVSLGAVRDVFLRALIVFPIAAAIIAVATFFGLDAVAWSLMLVIPLQALVALHFVRRHLPIGWGDIVGAIWRSAAVVGFTAAGPLVLVAASEGGFDLSIDRALATVPLAALGWLCGLRITGHPFLAEMIRTLSDIRSGTLGGGTVDTNVAL